MRVFSALLILLLIFTESRSEPFQADHLVRIPRVGAPALSPDGRSVVFPLRQTDMAANKGHTDLWVVNADGNSNARRLTSHEANDSSPAWSPNGSHVYFLSARTGSSQIWRIAMDGGEAEAVTDYPLSVTGFKLSPDGARLALTFSVYPDCQDLDCTAKRLLATADSVTTGVAYDRLFMRHWDHWTDNTLSRLFSVPINDGKAMAEPALVSGAVIGNVPSSPFGGSEEYNFSADGTTLYFSARLSGAKEPWSTNFDIYAMASNGTGEVQNLTADNPAWDTQPISSADGRYLAWKAMTRPGFEADRFRIMVMDLADGQRRELAPQWDRSPSSIAFGADGRSVIANAQDLGQKTLWSFDLDSGKEKRLVDNGYVSSFAVGEDHIVYARDSLDSPVELFLTNSRGAKGRQLTHASQVVLEKVEFGEFEQFSFKGWNDETVHGFVVKPAGYRSGEQYPVAFLIHGGPQGSFSNHFHYRWNPQTYAGQGFAAVFIDFHGSTGYGQAFTDAISEHWGDRPLEDLQKGLEAALQRYDFLDSDRVCALGASYGGYMINWIAGNWNDRFRCLVNHDGIFDNRMMYYTTEELWFPEWEHGGPQFRVPANYERFNPANHVDQWRTPMLVIHGELDYRVPVTQGIATFTALQRKGIPSKFLYYPDENHWVLKPHNSVQWHDQVNGWLHQYLDK